MPNWVVVDDEDAQIGYSSGWSVLKGSTRQWNGGVHTTSQIGATATYRFKGVAVIVVGTVPAGTGTQISMFSIDGGEPVRVNRIQSQSAAYDVDLFRSATLSEGIHTLTITNGGNRPFQLDKIEMLPGNNDPNPSPLYPPTGSQPQPSSSSPPIPIPPPQSSSRPPTSTPAEEVTTRPSTSRSTNEDQPSLSTSSLPQSSDVAQSAIVTTEFRSVVTERYRIITVTDSNGGVSTHTDAATGSSNQATHLPVGAIVGITLGSLAVVLIGLICLILILRKGRRRRYEKVEGNVGPSVTPFATAEPSLGLTTQTKSPLGSSDGPAPSQADSIFDTDSRFGTEPPPAYRHSSGLGLVNNFPRTSTEKPRL